MFGRKMRTKLPEKRGREEEDEETRKKHDESRLKQKEYVDRKKGTKEKKLKPGDKILLQRKKTTTKSPWDPVPYEVEQIKGSEITARRGEEVKRRAKNNVKLVNPRPKFYQAPQKIKTQNNEEEDLEGDLNKILGRPVPETQEDENREELRHREGADKGIQEGEDLENQPLHITVEISTDEESDHQEEEDTRIEEEVGDQEAEKAVGGEERPVTSITTRSGRQTRKPKRFREEGQVQLSPKERSRRKSRAKFKKFRDEK